MKKINIKILGMFFALALIFTACEKWIDTDINVNPDAPLEAPMGTILSGVQANMAYNTIGGSDLCRITAIWMQTLQGVERQSQSTADYIVREGDINNQWNTNYATTMENLYKIMEIARATPNPYYLGVAQTLMALTLGVTTDVWGSIPYDQCFQGKENLTPAFQEQQVIYDSILAMLDQAIVNFQMEGNFEEITGDMMYGGDRSLWLKAAFALKARYSLHLSKRDGDAYSKALTALPNAFASNDEDLQFIFGTAYTESNPLYQFMQERGDITMHATFITVLTQRFDPRLFVFATVDAEGGYSGNGFGETSYDASGPGAAVASPNSPVPFISYAECLFMKAECEYKTAAGDDVVRKTLYDAVTASMEFYGVLNPLYMAAYDSTLQTMSGDVLFNEVMTQKWISLFYQAEPFNDWRRTGLPALVANPFAVKVEIPRRYPYPTEEITYNPNVPAYGDIWQRVWWDAAID